MRRRWTAIPLSLAALAAGLVYAAAQPAQAVGTTIVVTTTADSGAGSLREAITNAQLTTDDDTITFDPAVFTSGSLHTITLASQLPNITKPLTIIGPGQNTLAISGDDTTRIFWVDQGTNTPPGVSLKISDLTLTRARTASDGGALYLQRAQVLLTRVTISRSQARDGGGIYAHSTGLTVVDSVFEDDTATQYGGAIRSDYGDLGEVNAYVDVQSSIIRRNVAAYGGGIYGARRVAISNSLITQNSATAAAGTGGGIYIGYSFQHEITGTTITNNTAFRGGGVVAGGGGWYKGQLTMNDDTVTDNTATSGDGSGGIWIGSTILKLTNSRVSNGAQGNCLPRWATISGTIWYSNIVDATGSTVPDGSCSQLDRAVLLTSWTASSGAGATSRVQAISDPPFAVGDKVYMCQPNGCNTSSTRTGTVSDVSLADDTFAITADATFGASSISAGAYGAVWSPRPKILSISPATGPGTGGTSVTITGAGFGSPGATPTPTVGVTFDGQAATSITHVDDTTLIVTTPAGAGAASVAVTSNAYSTAPSSNTMSGAFTYLGSAPTITGISPASGSVSGGDSVVISGTSLSGATGVTFGGNAAAFVVNGATQITATTPAGTAGAVDVVVQTPSGDDTEIGGFTYVASVPVTPPPTPANPPAAPVATAGDATATVSWTAPTSSGSYPISMYQATASPGGRSCLTSTLTCTVAGLTNTTAYTFTVRALSGAGWSMPSAPSNAVTPQAPPRPTITITGSRTGRVVTVSGSTTGFSMGAMLTPWVRMAGSVELTPMSNSVLVSMDGTFTWERRVRPGRAMTVYMTGGGVRSNIIRLP